MLIDLVPRDGHGAVRVQAWLYTLLEGAARSTERDVTAPSTNPSLPLRFLEDGMRPLQCTEPSFHRHRGKTPLQTMLRRHLEERARQENRSVGDEPKAGLWSCISSFVYFFFSGRKKDPAINDDHMHNDDHVYAGRWRRNGVGVHVPMDRVHVKRTLLPQEGKARTVGNN